MEKTAYKGRVADAIMQILPRSRELGKVQIIALTGQRL